MLSPTWLGDLVVAGGVGTDKLTNSARWIDAAARTATSILS
ncbi:hypothetical protein RMSM_06785 [Rhodopirellula maiorica SM1]|uniref:Uncharacterized protein n=1 Tax=Rhodopirellula maiorica SM1 TaxID=1265738 RepID=M5RB91_9BACT|nr:hypothetical protein RMSM_06785 [Rhodopirellula maiorica SM1]